jgi:hypothetical protein
VEGEIGMKYKVGDIVRIKNCPKVLWWSDGKKAVKAGKGKITHTDSKMSVYFLDNNKYGINFEEDMIESINTNWKKRLEDV